MDPELARQQLLAMRAELDKQDRATEADRAPVELDQTSVGRLSRMDAIRVQAMAQAGRQRRILERQRIEAALKRIVDGDFGYCIRCGEPIPEGRLKTDLAIPTCVTCSPG
ncbi:MAG: TraR/DksA family transcriptional regulator [Caulobacteraceae bacterium]